MSGYRPGDTTFTRVPARIQNVRATSGEGMKKPSSRALDNTGSMALSSKTS